MRRMGIQALYRKPNTSKKVLQTFVWVALAGHNPRPPQWK